MTEAKQITIKTITKDDLDATYPRVIAKVVNDKDKEVNLTIFKKKAKEQDDGTTTPEIIPQEGHSYMGYFKKPKEGFHMWSFNLAWEIHSEDTQEPIIEKELNNTITTECQPLDSNEIEDTTIDITKTNDGTEPETTTNIEPPQIITHPDIELRLRVAEIEARRENRLTRNIPLTEFLDNCIRIIKYVETGE